MVPDYFHYLFTGKITNEYTEATTTQCLNVHTRTWDPELLRAAGVCPSLMKEVIQPGTIIGTITPQLQQMTGLGPIPVVAPGTHDTASAVAAVPAEGDRWAYISSGTWSLMGIETTAPAGSPKAFEYNFTNEGGVCGTIRFLKNIMGMWMVQRCRAAFDKELDYNELTRMAAEAPAFVSLIDPEWDAFLNPPSMTEAIADFCRKTGQPVPANEGAYIRCCLESLAMQYRLVMQQICQICNKTFDTLHIVGGGSRNQLLNQLTADATATPVKTGPVEATVIGNLIMQAIGLGHIDSLKEARQIIGRSFEMETYTPKDPGRWDSGFERFLRLKKIKN
jgi:rhamnulokinase